MATKVLLGSLAVFVTRSVLDFVIHGVILVNVYATSIDTWRPLPEMRLGLMYVTIVITSIIFVYIYGALVREHTISTALKYGVLSGLATGTAIGYGTYSVLPLPAAVAFAWFMGPLVELTAGGCLLGLIFRE